MKLSEKRKTKLYGVVSDEIMDARIKIARLLNNHLIGNQVDLILYDLGKTAPQAALNVFETKNQA